MKIASRATPEGLAGHGLSITGVEYWLFWSDETFTALNVMRNDSSEIATVRGNSS